MADKAEWEAWLDGQLDEARGSGRWRRLLPLEGGGPAFALDGRAVVSFASNDYLGLSQHPRVKAAAALAVERAGTGAGSSRLVVGDRTIYHDLEAALAAWRGSEAALVFPTGFQANLAAVSTLGAGARIVSDELNHASIIDGARLARTEVCVYRHRDVEHARSLVEDAPGRALVVSDSVFSMDGDLAPVSALSSMCAQLGALLLLDDAHAVLGTEPVDPPCQCVRVGTLSKSLGSQGGYVTGDRGWIDLLVNKGRSFIFTTALAPASAAAAIEALAICSSPEGGALLGRLRRNVDALRPGHPSPIVPVVLGDEQAALAASASLLDAGLLVPAIRPPTVPAGTSRLRVSLSSAHDPGDVGRLARELAKLR